MHRVDQEELFARVMDYDLSDVTSKYSQEYGVETDKAKKYEEELKKFLFLSRVYQRGYAMPRDGDKYWHTFILHTEKYGDFCNSLFGRYIHHKPGELGNEVSTYRYIRFLVDYFRHFQQVPPADIWPLSDQIFGDNPTFELLGECIAPCQDIPCGTR